MSDDGCMYYTCVVNNNNIYIINRRSSVRCFTNYNYLMFVTVTIELGVCAAATRQPYADHSLQPGVKCNIYGRRLQII